MSTSIKTSKNNHLQNLLAILLILLPALAAGSFIILMEIQERIRYDDGLFSPLYQETYSSPGVVARELELALRLGDNEHYLRLTGLGKLPTDLLPNPNIILTILLDLDDHDYFHYLYLDISNYRRETHYIKEIGGRWTAAPQDSYFYYDSGQWTGVFTPIALVWYAVLIVFGIGTFIHHATARTRDAMLG